MVTLSAAYRQDSSLRTNQPALRRSRSQQSAALHAEPSPLEAEFVRRIMPWPSPRPDQSGDRRGQARKPYQPVGYYANIQFPDRSYVAESDDRAVSGAVCIRTGNARSCIRCLANFDAPSPRRRRLHARCLQHAAAGADALERSGVRGGGEGRWPNLPSDMRRRTDARLEYVYQRTLARSIRPNESASLKQFLATQRSYF